MHETFDNEIQRRFRKRLSKDRTFSGGRNIRGGDIQNLVFGDGVDVIYRFVPSASVKVGVVHAVRGIKRRVYGHPSSIDEYFNP